MIRKIYSFNIVLLNILNSAAFLSALDFGSTGQVLPGGINGSIAAADIDSDGDIDLIVTGENQDGIFTKVFQNNGSGEFIEKKSDLPAVKESSIDFGDIDNDNDPDIIIASALAYIHGLNNMEKEIEDNRRAKEKYIA